MQNIPLLFKKLVLVAAFFDFSSTAIAQESLSNFEQSLQDAGWSVEKNKDGSLIIEPNQISKSPQDSIPMNEAQWPQLQEKLQAAGWTVVREENGSLRLTPPVTQPFVEPEPATQEPEAGGGISQPALIQQLKAAGWTVIESPDGSVLLYPRDIHQTGTPLPCPGTNPDVEVPLPVDTWDDARKIAVKWLDNQQPFSAAVGKIRRIFNIHLVSIVADSAPYALKTQIAIRNKDGAVIVLY